MDNMDNILQYKYKVHVHVHKQQPIVFLFITEKLSDLHCVQYHYVERCWGQEEGEYRNLLIFFVQTVYF